MHDRESDTKAASPSTDKKRGEVRLVHVVQSASTNPPETERDLLTWRQAKNREGGPVRTGNLRWQVDPDADETAAEQRMIEAYRAERQRLQDAGGAELLRRNHAMKGRPRRSDRELAVVAEVYARLCEAGVRPLKPAVKRELDDRRLSVELSGLDKLLKAARDRGLLTCPGKGRVGGELTEKARELLAAF